MASPLQRVLTLKQLRLVSALGRELNLSRTAEVLHSTQPAASRALAQLEALLDVQLFHRTTKRIVPTAAGMSLLQHANRVLAEIDLAHEDLLGLRGEVHQELRVGVLASFSPDVLARALVQSRQLQPHVLVMTQMLALDPLYEQLLDGRIDLMLAHAELSVDINLVEVFPLYEEFSSVLAGPEHPLHRKKRPGWQELADQAWVLPPPQTPLRPKIDRMLSVYRSSSREATGPDVQTDSSLLALQMLQHTPMLWAIADRQARQFVASGPVRMLPLPGELLRGPMCCMRLRQSAPKAHQRMFMDCLRGSS